MIDAPPVPFVRGSAGRVFIDETPAHAFDRIEAEMLQQPQVDIPPTHIFADGIYAREIVIPAGTLLTGKIHRTEHINIISKGEISVYTEGEGVKRIVAPAVFVATPGTRRLGFAHTECVWTTVHSNPGDERDLAVLEARLIEPHDAVEALNHGGSPCHGSLPQ
jgi:hypothetical protein